MKAMLKVYTVRAFYVKAGTPRDLSLDKLYLIFFNDLLNDITFQLCIYTDDSNIYYCLSNNSDTSEKVKLVAGFQNDP